jgi:hypothetical protein
LNIGGLGPSDGDMRSLLLQLLILFASCAPWLRIPLEGEFYSDDKFAAQAAVELGCPEARISLQKLSGSQSLVTGCGRQAIYSCWRSRCRVAQALTPGVIPSQ